MPTTIEHKACIGCDKSLPETLLKDRLCSACRESEIIKEASARAKKKPSIPTFKRKPDKTLKERRAKHETSLAERQKSIDEDRNKTAFDAKMEAARLLARRELCRRRYLPFVMEMVPGYMPGWVHVDLASRLEKFSRDVAEGRSPRLMVFMPPRHGKSELTSKTFPGWHLGHYPDHEFIVCSYAAELAETFSREVRSKLRDADYHKIFPQTKLDRDTQSAKAWQTTAKGGLSAAGVGGPVTGKGAHILIIDDPVKNKEEADSSTMRDMVWGWYQTTAYTRLAPGAGVLVIQTRWHFDDLSGRLLRQMEEAAPDEKEDWEIVNYPAEAEVDERYRRKGEALHPERYPENALRRIRNSIGEEAWQALYQQNPVAVDGDLFQRDWLRFYRPDELPPHDELTFFTAWDLAIGQKDYNDFSVGIVAGVDRDENIWVVDIRRGRYNSLELVDTILELDRIWRPMQNGIEKSAIEMSILPLLKKRVQETRQYRFHYKELKVGRSNKVARSSSIRGRIQQGKVLFPERAPWTQSLVNELLQFPKGVNDDQVDALSWLGRMLEDLRGALPAPVKRKPSWRDKLVKYRAGNSNAKGFMAS